MTLFLIGFVIGLAIGIAIGLRMREPWGKRKKTEVVRVAAGENRVKEMRVRR